MIVLHKVLFMPPGYTELVEWKHVITLFAKIDNFKASVLFHKDFDQSETGIAFAKSRGLNFILKRKRSFFLFQYRFS